MAEAARVEFERMLVHNLKTPLTGILASLEMLHDGDLGALNDSQHSAIAIMQSQGAELLGMIDELLELGRLQSPGLRVCARTVDVAGFMDTLVTEWQPRLGGRLTIRVSPELQRVHVDADILRRVLGNLLMNAAIHGGHGVGVSLAVERGGEEAVHFTVADDGPGIPAGDADRIFDPFVRLEATRTEGPRTSGLGLSYCRAAVVAMGGTIALAPSARGATFRIDLPASIPATSAEPAR